MILLDTKVLSELMKAKPAVEVLSWIDQQPAGQLYISSITVAEILYGIARLLDGKRKTAFADPAKLMFDEDFAGRILPFDTDAAVRYPVWLQPVRRRERCQIWPMRKSLPSRLYTMRLLPRVMFGTSIIWALA